MSLDFSLDVSVFMSLFAGYLTFFAFIFGIARAINFLSSHR